MVVGICLDWGKMMSELKLTDRAWADFYIKDIFQTYKGPKGLQTHTGAYVSKQLLSNGIMPRITVKDTLNGIDSFCYSTDKNFRFFKNFISVSFLGSVFYHPYEASFDMKVHALIPLEIELNSYTAKFLISAIKNCITLLSYGNQLSSTDLPKVKILLPVNSEGKPDWQFMEDFIKQKEQKQRKQLRDYYANKALNLMLSGCLKKPKWHEFHIRDYFDFVRGNQNNMAKCESGDIPLVSAKKVDNGYKDFIAPNNKKLFPKHILTLNNDGDGGVGLAYYQAVESALDTHVTALIPKIELPQHTLLFLARCISHQKDKFSHGYSLNNQRLNAQKIMLPIDENGQPNWQFMENFMRQIEQNKIQILLKYYNSLNYMKNCGGGVAFCRTQIKWAVFAIEDVCEILSGVRLTKQDMINGNLPFVGASDSNNGITAFVANQNSSLDKNVLGVNYNGSVVENFYHPYECLFSDDVKRLKIKSENADKYAYLFLKAAILQQKSKYQYGYKFNATRMSRQKILLPENETGQPDWAYMSHYMQQIELRQIMRYLAFQAA